MRPWELVEPFWMPDPSQATSHDSSDVPSIHLSPATQDSAPPVCLVFGTHNDRKNTVICSGCERKTHLTCVSLTRAQVQTLLLCHCEDCLQATLLTRNINDVPDTKETAPVDLAEALANLKRRSRVQQHVPRRLRHRLAAEIADLINTAIEQRTAIAW